MFSCPASFQSFFCSGTEETPAVLCDRNREGSLKGKIVKPIRSKDSPRVGEIRSFSLLRILLWASLFFVTRAQKRDPFPAEMELSSLNGVDGFVIHGAYTDERRGISISSAGDLNGDGIQDILLGGINGKNIHQNGTNLGSIPGRTYVIFGRKGFGSEGVIDLLSINNKTSNETSFYLEGDLGGGSGVSVSSAGDVNGDGRPDLLIGDPWFEVNRRRDAGRTFLVYGPSASDGFRNRRIADLNSTQKLIFTGSLEEEKVGQVLSYAGDVNGDGLDDFLIGAPGTTQIRFDQRAYLVFGHKWPDSINSIKLSTLNGSNGFRLAAAVSVDGTGNSLATAGDINDDGIDDFVIGASRSDRAYVVFGSQKERNSGVLKLSDLNGQNGFILKGETPRGSIGTFGSSVSLAGDVNDDGQDDLIIGAPAATFGNRTFAGMIYVIFGNKTIGNSGLLEVSNLDGKYGFKILGKQMSEQFGTKVSSAGDLNGDGVDDLLIGAFRGISQGPEGFVSAGNTYVIFGGKDIGANGIIDSANLNGTNGFVLHGEKQDDHSGSSVINAGDVNGDGVDDILIGAKQATPSGRSKAGKVYVLFGRNVTESSGTTSTIIDPTETATATLLPSTELGSTIIPSESFLMTSFSQKNSIPLYVGISIGGAVLGISLCSGGFLLFRKRLNDKKVTQTDNQTDMQSAREENIYDRIHIPQSSGHYNDWPSGEPQPSKDHYDKYNLDDLNRQDQEYQNAKMLSMHEGYDDIPNI